MFTNEFGQVIFHIQGGNFKSGNERRLSVQYMKDDLETVLEKHSKMAQKNQAQPTAETQTGEKEPDAFKDAWIIGGSIVIFGLFVFAGLCSYRTPTRQGIEKVDPCQKQEHIRALRQKLLAEELTEDEYLIERKKLV